MPRRARAVVSTYEQVPHLRRALLGWLRQTTEDFVLAIADDGSGPETRALIEEMAARFTARGLRLDHVWHPHEGRRKTRILNEAVRRGEGEPLLVFSDGDCIPPDDFVARHLAAHEPLSFHVGGAYRLTREATERLTDEDVTAGRHLEIRPADQVRDLRRRRRKSIWGMRFRRVRRPKILGLNFAMDRALFEAVNGFDERFVGYGLEDDDIRDRAMRHRPRPRVKVMYAENDVWHLWHPPGEAGWDVTRAIYAGPRPVRCAQGLEPAPPSP